MSLLELYGIFLLINLKDAATVILVTGMMLSASYVGFCILAEQKFSISKWLIAGLISCGILVTVIPTEKQIMMIAGSYFVSNIDGIEKVPPNLVKALNKMAEDFTQPVEKK